MKTKKTLKILLSILVISLLTATAAFAVQQGPMLSENVEKVNPETVAKAGSSKEINGVVIYKDAIGGSVLHNLPGGVKISKEEADAQYKFQKNHPEEEEKAAKADLEIRKQKPDKYPAIDAAANYYDIEYNPILIGYWNEDDCGPDAWKTYARHTLGTKTSTSNGDYLTSYGDTSWYNTSGWKALPYRNGSAQVPGQDVVDVASNAVFSIRDLGTNNATTVSRSDFGPNQCPGSRYTKVICDLDKSTFISLHGNSTDGIFYSRTWVPLTNWNP